MSIEKYIATIIEREGGYVDHPADSGGPTKYGVTLDTLANWRGCEVTAEDVSSLIIEEAYKIYKQNYLVKPGLGNITDYRLQALMLDAAIHHGAGQAIKFLQQILQIKDDGVMGAITIQVANNFASIELLRKKYLGQRIRFIGRLITKRSYQSVFAEGWLNRMADLLEELI